MVCFVSLSDLGTSLSFGVWRCQEISPCVCVRVSCWQQISASSSVPSSAVRCSAWVNEALESPFKHKKDAQCDILSTLRVLLYENCAFLKFSRLLYPPRTFSSEQFLVFKLWGCMCHWEYASTKCRRMSRTGGKLISSAYVASRRLHERKLFDSSLTRRAHRAMTYKKKKSAGPGTAKAGEGILRLTLKIYWTGEKSQTSSSTSSKDS